MWNRALAGVAIVVAGIAVGRPRIASETDDSGWRHRPGWFVPFTGAVQGRTDAEAAIAAGMPTRMTGMLHRPGDVDLKSGLPIEVPWMFSPPDPEGVAYLRSYNAAIDAARAAGRLAGWNFRDRFVTQADACARLDAAGLTIEPGAAAVRSADGRYRIWVEAPEHGVCTFARCLVAGAPDGAERRLAWFDAAPTIAFAGSGAQTLLVRDADRHGIDVFELDHGFRLQRFQL